MTAGNGVSFRTHGHTDTRTNGRTEGQTETDGHTEGRNDRWTDRRGSRNIYLDWIKTLQSVITYLALVEATNVWT